MSYIKNHKSSTFQFLYLETGRMRKQGRTKDKGGTVYEVSTCFVAQNVRNKYQSHIHGPSEH